MAVTEPSNEKLSACGCVFLNICIFDNSVCQSTSLVLKIPLFAGARYHRNWIRKDVSELKGGEIFPAGGRRVCCDQQVWVYQNRTCAHRFEFIGCGPCFHLLRALEGS